MTFFNHDFSFFQVESTSYTSRRLPAPSVSDRNSTDVPDSVPTYRSRNSRQREETPQNVVRTRTRSRPESTERPVQPERPDGNNERFDSRRTRTRSRPVETPRAEITEKTFRNAAIRSRTRPMARTSTQAPEVSSSTVDEVKIEVSNTNVDDITKIATKQVNTDNTATQFRRRSSTIYPTESLAPKRGRGRVITRPVARALDLESSGSTNSVLTVDKAPTTARTSADLRNARKLRYKTRPSETESNLTGEGSSSLNEVKSSQIENITSQPEIQTAAPVFVERIVHQSTETNKPKSTTLKVTRVVRRPLARGKATHTPVVATPKKSDDIGEDDNYPESFKALIQAKNAVSSIFLRANYHYFKWRQKKTRKCNN